MQAYLVIQEFTFSIDSSEISCDVRVEKMLDKCSITPVYLLGHLLHDERVERWTRSRKGGRFQPGT